MPLSQHVKLYNFGNFVADVGGYLGLFLGASILSISDGIISGLKYLKGLSKSKTSVQERF